MAGEWKTVLVGDLAASSKNALVGGPFGSNLVSRDYVDSGVPVIRGNNMGTRWISGPFAHVTPEKAAALNANLARPGDLVFRQRGTLGQVSLVPSTPFDRYVVSQSQMKLTVDLNLADPLFVYYAMNTAQQRDYVEANAVQTGVPHTNLGILRTTPLLLPNLLEQRAITHILGALDDKIELNSRMSETLEAMARALFKAWFVDFDPVRAKVEDTAKPSGVESVHPDSFVDSELGEIPRGWSVAPIGDLADVEKGLSYKGSGLVEQGGLPMVNLGCFGGDGIFKAEAVKRYAGEHRERHLISAGDLVVANTDMTQNRVVLGSPALVPSSGGERRFLFTHHTFAIRFRPGQDIWRYYVYFALLQPTFREVAEGFATGTTVLALPKDGLLRLKIVLPDEPVRKAFECHVSKWLARSQAARAESRTLAALRDTLLPELISGELRVKDAERFVGEAV